MKRQELIRELKAHGNLRTLRKILEYDYEQVNTMLRSAGPDVFQRVQGKANTIDEYITLITNALR